MTTCLELRGLTKRFGGLVAVNDVSFRIDEGDIVGLLGPNGSGKTTALNVISGALKPSGGRVTLRGQDITGMPAHRIALHGISRTFQLVRPLPSLSVADNVLVSLAFGRKRHWGAEADELVREKLAFVGLEGRGEENVGSLTYIDQKRMELARALAAEPKLLLLDEWLAGLNPAELKTGIELVRHLQGAGITILLVEHIMEAVRALCSRCVVMNAGQLIAEGATADVLKEPEVISAYLGDDHA